MSERPITPGTSILNLPSRQAEVVLESAEEAAAVRGGQMEARPRVIDIHAVIVSLRVENNRAQLALVDARWVRRILMMSVYRHGQALRAFRYMILHVEQCLLCAFDIKNRFRFHCNRAGGAASE